MNTPPTAAKPGDRLGPFGIERVLSEGKHTQVLLGAAAGPGQIRRSVAIKRLRPKAARDHNTVGSFRYEATVSSCLYHPNLVGMISAGESRDGEHYFVMELVKGWTLRNVISRARLLGEPIPFAAALSLVHSVAAGLHYMHELTGADGRSLGLVHRDLAGDNVMIGEHGYVKVLDFGSATAAAIERVAPRRLERTTVFTAPECICGDPVDRRADVFALGMLLHQLARGLNDDRGSDLMQLLGRALEPDAGNRLATARDFQVGVEAIAAGRGKTLSNVCLGMYVRRLFAKPVSRDPLPGLTAARAKNTVHAPPTLGRTRVRVVRKRRYIRHPSDTPL